MGHGTKRDCGAMENEAFTIEAWKWGGFPERWQWDGGSEKARRGKKDARIRKIGSWQLRNWSLTSLLALKMATHWATCWIPELYRCLCLKCKILQYLGSSKVGQGGFELWHMLADWSALCGASFLAGEAEARHSRSETKHSQSLNVIHQADLPLSEPHPSLWDWPRKTLWRLF